MTTTAPQAFDAARFRAALGSFPTGVAVVTTVGAAGEPAGMTVGSFTSVSLEPPLVGFFPAAQSRTLAHIRAAGHFCVNVLAAHQESWCRRFATATGDRFADLSWVPTPLGAPILREAILAIDCSVASIQPTGDHYFVLGAVRALHSLNASPPLLFFRGGYGSFSAPSLMARPEADLIRPLARANLARAAISAAADDLGVGCVASAVVGSDVVQLVSAAPARSSLSPAPVGTRMPWIPPVGRGFAAWSDDPARQDYLGRAQPPLSPPARASYERMFDQARSQGWSVVLSDSKLTDAERILERRPTAELTEAERADVIQRLAQVHATEPADLKPGQPYPVRLIAVPVMAPGGLALVLSAQQLAAPVTGARIEAIARRLVQAAGSVADLISRADA